MKFCPFCGSALPAITVSFCPECGNPVNDKNITPVMPLQAANTSQSDRIDKKLPPKTPARANHQTQNRKRASAQLPRPKPDERMRANKNLGYDGYYNDVPTEDKGRIKENLDPELIKRIAMIAGGVVFLIILSIIIMSVL